MSRLIQRPMKICGRCNKKKTVGELLNVFFSFRTEKDGPVVYQKKTKWCRNCMFEHLGLIAENMGGVQ